MVADRYIESQELQPKTIASYRTAVKRQEQGTVGKYRSSANFKKNNQVPDLGKQTPDIVGIMIPYAIRPQPFAAASRNRPCF